MRQNGAVPAFHRNAAIRKVAVSTTARTVNGQRRRAASGRAAANASTTSQAFGAAKSYPAAAGLVTTLLTTSADNAAASSESTSQSLVQSLVNRPSAVGSRATDASIPAAYGPCHGRHERRTAESVVPPRDGILR